MRGPVVLLLLIASLAAATTTKRLILKDGSYQSVQKYEIEGDRVRYLSAERYQWEEIPSSMIDWEATRKYEDDLARKAAVAEQKPDPAAEAKERAEQEAEARAPEIAPNLRLPEAGGVFALDSSGSTPQLQQLSQSASQIVQHTAKYVLLKKINPLASRTETIELKGDRAAIRLRSPRPLFFLNPVNDSETGEKRAGGEQHTSGDAYRYEIVKLESKRDSRLVGTTRIDPADQVTQDRTIIPVIAQVMAGGIWIKIEPKLDLPPGEYAVVEAFADARISSYVWDFGIDAGTATR